MPPDTLERLVKRAWHEDTARNSIERWHKLCGKQGISNEEDLGLLVSIFGASWYFTRLMFSTGCDAIGLIRDDNALTFDKVKLVGILAGSLEPDEIEQRVDRLRVLKNTCMLQMLSVYLKGRINLQKLEYLLTVLAEATLHTLIQSLAILPQHASFPAAVMGMGRMAGYEMTFGSDLDLIFLHDSEDQEVYARLGKSIRLLLRTIALPAAAGTLYDVDMRLRPHGNSGPLVTSYRTFEEYHAGNRDIWERQMMTRCRIVYGAHDKVEGVLESVNRNIYSTYETGMLKREIMNMRMKVQKQLGNPAGKYEIKRGYGGIMDIDFITHYLQLAHGNSHSGLRSQATRTILEQAAVSGLLDEAISRNLLEQYDYLKRLEMCLRLFDLKSVDTFTSVEDDNVPLARAMGHGDDAGGFIDEYRSVTKKVRDYFLEILGD